MPFFTFFKHKLSGSTPEFELLECPDFMAATYHARKLLEGGGHDAIEIFNGEHALQTLRADYHVAGPE